MKLKYAWIVLIISVIFTVPFRVYQLFKNMGDNFENLLSLESSFIFVAIVIVFVLILIIMSFLSKDAPKNQKLRKNIFIGVVSFVLSFFMLINGLGYVLNYCMVNSDIKELILGIAAVLASVVFIVVGVCFCKGNNTFVNLPLLALIPTIWAGIRLAVIFIYNVLDVTSTVNMFSVVLETVFILLFMFTFSRMLGSIEGKNMTKRLFGFGLPAILSILAYNIPIMVICISKLGALSILFRPTIMVDILMAILIFGILFEISANIRKESKDNLEVSVEANELSEE